MIYHEHLRQYVIRPVLAELESIFHIRATASAEELLVLTAAVESDGGKWLYQLHGPRYGIYRMDRATIDETMKFIRHKLSRRRRPEVKSLTLESACEAYKRDILAHLLCGNLFVATTLARMCYFHPQERLPAKADISALAAYWREHWNLKREKGDPALAEAKYHAYCAGLI